MKSTYSILYNCDSEPVAIVICKGSFSFEDLIQEFIDDHQGTMVNFGKKRNMGSCFIDGDEEDLWELQGRLVVWLNGNSDCEVILFEEMSTEYISTIKEAIDV